MEQDPGKHHIEVVRPERDDRAGMNRRLGDKSGYMRSLKGVGEWDRFKKNEVIISIKY